MSLGGDFRPALVWAGSTPLSQPGKSPISHYHLCHSPSTHCKSPGKASLCLKTSHQIEGGKESVHESAELCNPHSKLSFIICSEYWEMHEDQVNYTTLLIDRNNPVRNLPATDRVCRKNISILAQFQIISKGLLTNKMIVAEFLPRIIFKQAAQTLLLMLLCGL